MSPAHGQRKSTGKLLRAALRYLRKQDGRAVKRARVGQMTPSRLRHTIEGDTQPRNGYHYRPGGEDFPGRRIGPVTRRDPATGVYEAPVQFERPPGSGNWVNKVGAGRSTFFPDDWTQAQCDDAINRAFHDPATTKNGGVFNGVVNGVKIQGYYDQATGGLRNGHPIL
jgi:hypothetical protein